MTRQADHHASPELPPELPRVYLTAARLAAILDVDPKTVYRWASAKNSAMPQLRIGGVVRFPRDRVLAWLRRCEGQRVELQSHPLRRTRGEVVDSPSVVPDETAPCANPWASEAADG